MAEVKTVRGSRRPHPPHPLRRPRPPPRWSCQLSPR